MNAFRKEVPGILRIVLFIVLSCPGFSAFSQKSDQAAFLDQFLKKYTDKIVYQEYAVQDFTELKKTLNKRKAFLRPDYGEWHGLKTSVPQSISLTKAEIASVIGQLKSSGKQNGWSKGAIRNSQLVSESEMESIFRDKDKGWPYFNQKYGKSLWQLSKPIFIRNGTFCIFYFSRSGGNLSGGGGFSLYAKDNGVWRNYAMITMWVS